VAKNRVFVLLILRPCVPSPHIGPFSFINRQIEAQIEGFLENPKCLLWVDSGPSATCQGISDRKVCFRPGADIGQFTFTGVGSV